MGLRAHRGDASRLPVTQGEYGTQVTYPADFLPGLYRISPRLQPADPRAQQFAVRPPRAESDLTPLTDEQWDRLAHDLRFERILNRAGWPMTRLGEPVAIGNTIAIAGTLPADEKSFERVRPPHYRSAVTCADAYSERSAA